MATFYALLLLTVYVSTTAALPPCTCTRHFQPVCGSDGNTYANPCVMGCEQSKGKDVTLAHEGPCDTVPDCICTFQYSPVCGTDGQTYGNECSLNCAKKQKPDLEKKFQGSCEQVQVAETDNPDFKPDPVRVAETAKETVQVAEPTVPLRGCVCTRKYQPVCGSNGQTYANPCLLNCDKETSTTELTIYHEGACDPTEVMVAESSCKCGKDLKPVCGSNNQTYPNQCVMECAGQTMKYDRPCRDDIHRSN